MYLVVQLAEAEDALLACVARIIGRSYRLRHRSRSNKTVDDSTYRIDVVIAGATTSALTLGATVPVAFHCLEVKGRINCSAGYATVGRIEWYPT